MASVGAQRGTFFIDIVDGADVTPAVAQVSASVLGSVPASAEAEMLRLAADAGVPVPEVFAVSDDLPGVGGAGEGHSDIAVRIQGKGGSVDQVAREPLKLGHDLAGIAVAGDQLVGGAQL